MGHDANIARAMEIHAHAFGTSLSIAVTTATRCEGKGSSGADAAEGGELPTVSVGALENLF